MENGADEAAFFAKVSRELLNEPEEQITFQRVALLAVEAVPACDWSGVSLRRRRGRVESIASSAPMADQLDSWQNTLGEGPGVDSIEKNQLHLVEDVRTETRWPGWVSQVASAGVGSSLSLPLATEAHALGVLNLYAAHPLAFTADAVERALIFASHASTAIGTARLVTGLQTAVQSRHLIGVAQGIIMARYEMTLDASFEVLRRYSSHSNRKLRDVAQLVVEQRLLPARYVDLDVAGRDPDAVVKLSGVEEE